MRPEDVGFTGMGLVLGKHSGRHAFKERLHALGITVTDAQLVAAFERFKVLADKKKQVFDEDLIAIVDDEVKVVNEVWEFVDVSYQSGTTVKPQISITLTSEGKEYTKASTGDGPVDACYKAIEALTKVKCTLLDYAIKSVTQGQDALGEVTVKVQVKEKTVIAQGTSTDIVEASVKAYINAINKVLTKAK